MPRNHTKYLRAASLLFATLAPVFIFAQPQYETEFRQARAGYRFEFPRDLRPRHGYRTSWWYYTGHMHSETKRRFGFQFTIFKIERAPNPTGDYRTGHTIYMLHLALTDEHNKRFDFTERLQRQFPGIAAYDSNSRTVYVENNTLFISDDGRTHRIRARADDFELDLDLSSKLGPLVHGANGISTKGFRKDSASHYFSVPDLQGTAVLRRPGQTAIELATDAWMDVEFGSNVLSKSQSGWDWLHATLADGRRYMIFRVRDTDGPDYYAASVIDARGNIRNIATEQIEMRTLPKGQWQSPHTGARYPLEWEMTVEDVVLRVTPWFENQEANAAERQAAAAGPGSRVAYWEGAVDVTASSTKQRDTPVQGVGYLELTGYAASMGGTL